MANKICSVLFILFFILHGLYGQDMLNPENSDVKIQKSYFIEEGKEGTFFYQHLSWEAVEDILGFEFVLEKKDQSGRWIQIDKKFLEENSINVSLKPGKYRYRVSVVNFLNQVEIASDYRNFDVRAAYQPEVLSLSENTIYFDEQNSDFIIVSGNNIFPETVFTLSKNNEAPIPCEIIDYDKAAKKIKLQINFSQLNPGTYALTAKDPSGLYDSSKIINLKFQKPIDVFLSLGYTFNYFIQNQTFYKYFKSNAYPIGSNLRLSFIPIKKFYGNIGFNLSFSNVFLKSKDSVYKLSAAFLFPQFNLVYMYPIIKHRLNFDLHIGGAAAFLIQAKFEYPEYGIKSPPYWFWGISAAGGTALQIYLYKKLYIEINLDHLVLFRKNFPKYIIQPSLSIGWEF